MHFYERVLRQMLEGPMRRADSLLVVCGGTNDAETLRATGFTQAVISNVDDQYAGILSPYEWAHADAEALPYADASFDWAIVNGGLHHCRSPHRALIEMCRVARKGAVVLEARDSSLMRAATAMGLTSVYEFEPIALSGYTIGGVQNTAVPNFIYRWTEREVRKTVESAFPERNNSLRFFYGMTLPTQRLTMAGPLKRFAGATLGRTAMVVQIVLPRQCNCFAFAVINDGDKPWIIRDPQPRLRADYKLEFDPCKYQHRI
jgi:ubiquinone/menaquinone biosynthesis C-methylase UbiE